MTAVVLFTRDLRVHDNPTLWHAANRDDSIVALYVLDESILAHNGPNRAAFLADCLADLDTSLKQRGVGGLTVRRGDVVDQTVRVAAEVDATAVHVASDWSRHARTRQRRLSEQLGAQDRALHLHDDTHPVVPPGTVLPSGRNHFAVFTPYHRRWADLPLRRRFDPPDDASTRPVDRGQLPTADEITAGQRARSLPKGGETAGRERLESWLGSPIRAYADHHDDLAENATSRLSPYLHFGCVSPVEIVGRAGRSYGAEAFVRQLAWRDFHLQVLAARPDTAQVDYRDRGDHWRGRGRDFDAWRAGRTGIPIVDAGMRQLMAEGWMHNRARLIVGSFLTKHLYIDWRAGAAHFLEHLVDADIANNQQNWQWVAGTGTDTRPNRVLNPLRQAERFDPRGDYVRRYVDELATIEGRWVHKPWALPDDQRRALDYPAPLVDLDEARRSFLQAREAGEATRAEP